MQWNLFILPRDWSEHQYLKNLLLWIVQIFACWAAAWVIAQFFWWLATPEHVTLPLESSRTLLEQSHSMKARHFFGLTPMPQSSTEDENARLQGVPDTRWRLLGTYIDTEAGSRALLAMDGGDEVVTTRVGSSLPSGHKVEEVRTDSVVLSKDAQREEVTLRPITGESQTQGSVENRFDATEPPPFIKDPR